MSVIAEAPVLEHTQPAGIAVDDRLPFGVVTPIYAEECYCGYTGECSCGYLDSQCRYEGTIVD